MANSLIIWMKWTVALSGAITRLKPIPDSNALWAPGENNAWIYNQKCTLTETLDESNCIEHEHAFVTVGYSIFMFVLCINGARSLKCMPHTCADGRCSNTIARVHFHAIWPTFEIVMAHANYNPNNFNAKTPFGMSAAISFAFKVVHFKFVNSYIIFRWFKMSIHVKMGCSAESESFECNAIEMRVHIIPCESVGRRNDSRTTLIRLFWIVMQSVSGWLNTMNKWTETHTKNGIRHQPTANWNQNCGSCVIFLSADS